MRNTYRIIKSSFNQITMKAKALDPDGKEIVVKGTWAWAPQLRFYDENACEWIDDDKWVFVYHTTLEV